MHPKDPKLKDFRDFFKSYIIIFLLAGSLVLNIASFVMLAFFIHPSESSIILHYNVYFGVDLIGDWWQVYLSPATALLFTIFNLILAYIFYTKKERVASYLLLLASFMIQLGALIASISVSLVNY